MKINSLIMGVIGVVICAIMVSGALLPSVASAGVLTVYNGNGSMSALDTDNFVAEYTYTANTGITWTVNGVEQSDFMDLTESTRPIIMSDQMIIYADFNTSGVPAASFANYFDGSNPRNRTNVTLATISCTNGSMTVNLTYGEAATQEFTVNVDWVYVAHDGGDYRLIANQSENITIYYSNVNDVRGCNIAYNPYGWFSFEGTNVTHAGNTYTATIDSKKIGEDVYSFEISKTAADNEYTVVIPTDSGNIEVNPYFYIVPYEINGYSFGFNSAVNNILAILPIIAIAGLIMAGIYVFITRK